MRKIVIYLCFSYTLLPSLNLSAQVNISDSLALVDLYNSTNGATWINNTNWLSARPVSTWYGISLYMNNVSSIQLDQNNLTGPIPASIGDFFYLQSLSLDANHLGAGIPASLGNLANLQYLSLIQNQLTGSIPPSLGNLTSLTWIRLADNQLSGPVPASLGNLTNLQYFYLGDNQLSGSIPSSLGNLLNLIYLQLYLNQLTGNIPPSLGNLQNLQDLELEFNQLTGVIPPSIGNLGSLSTLDLEYNQLTGQIPVITGNPNFLNLFLDNNFFTFAGMEQVAQKPVWQKIYAPQGTIPIIVSCGKLSVSVGGTPSNNTYRWYDLNGTLQLTSTGNSTFSPSSSGKFYVTVTNSIATDLTLHSDTAGTYVVTQTLNASICPGKSYTLPSGRQVGVSGTFYDTVHFASGCGDSLISILNLVIIAPTKFTNTATICEGQFYTLPSGKKISSPGLYNDTLYSEQGCDSIITALNLLVTIPLKINTTAALCMGQNYKLPSGKFVSIPGIYSDTLRSTQLGCDSIITNLIIKTDSSAAQIIDTLAMCPGSAPIVLNAGTIANVYLWNTGSTLNSILVSSPGVYSAVVNGINGCIAYDTFSVIAHNAPSAILDQNIILCGGQSKLVNAGSGYKSYLWNTGSSNQTISINSVGLYWVTVTDQYNCQGSDTTLVSKVVDPPAGFLSDTAVCKHSTISIAPGLVFSKYLWNTGETTRSITINIPGVYTLTVTDSNSCVGTDHITVKEKHCIDSFYIPTAFTPNGDGYNDIFKPTLPDNIGAGKYHFVVYNRFGQTVFESSNASYGWNGNLYGVRQVMGVYVWTLQFQPDSGQATIKKGVVVLIR